MNKITVEDAQCLEMLPTVDEIRQVVWSCDPSKAPGVDGFNLNFVRNCWDTLGRIFLHLF